MGALEGIRVIDFGQYIAGPMAAMFLADQGADVIRVEHPNGPLLDSPAVERETMLLAPLDPLLYDRELTRKLWGFDYTWEVYTPLAKRKRGYYALPVLAGDRLCGHVDAKRNDGSLAVVSKLAPRGVSLSAAIASLAQFLGLKVARTRSAAPPPPGRPRR